MGNSSNGTAIRDKILKQGTKLTGETAYFRPNITEAVGETGRGLLTVDSGERLGAAVFKASKDFSRGIYVVPLAVYSIWWM